MRQNFHMIDVGEKQITRRRAVATGSIHLCEKTMDCIRRGESPKGNILSIAEIAGITAAKNTVNLLPLCHHLTLDVVRIWFELGEGEVTAFCEVICSAKTGVEMEALVGVNVCLLTVYDLAKAIDPVIDIRNIHLQIKEGGKSGVWTHPGHKPNAKVFEKVDRPRFDFDGLRFGVGTLSDRASQGLYEDESGRYVREYLKVNRGEEVFYSVIPDEESDLRDLVNRAVENKVDVLLLSGGTGLSARDITPDVMKSLADKELIGFGELQRQFGANSTPLAWLSRSSAYVVSQTLVVLFPGSPRAVSQGLDCLSQLIPHAVRMVRGEAHHGRTDK